MKTIYLQIISLILVFNFGSTSLLAQRSGKYRNDRSYERHHQKNKRHYDRYEYDDIEDRPYHEEDIEYCGTESYDLIQLAFILDASGSMDELLYQAKSQLWQVVNGIHYTQRVPRLEIALYTYGHKYAGHRNGYIKQLVPFTQELDWLADELETLRADGKKEYAGLAIEEATRQLRWKRRGNVLKLIYIAGNEAIDQGPVSIRTALRSAREAGIQVNTIYCGSYEKGVYHNWKKAATLGGGIYQTLDMGINERYVSSPYDPHFSRLNRALNMTYIPYGQSGLSRSERQRRHDRTTSNRGKSRFAERTIAKASSTYKNTSWDLVDAVYAGEVDLRNIPNRDLPLEMRRMSLREKRRFIEDKKRERDEVKTEILALGQKRANYMTKKRATKIHKRPSFQEIVVEGIGSANVRDAGKYKPKRNYTEEETVLHHHDENKASNSSKRNNKYSPRKRPTLYP